MVDLPHKERCELPVCFYNAGVTHDDGREEQNKNAALQRSNMRSISLCQLRLFAVENWYKGLKNRYRILSEALCIL